MFFTMRIPINVLASITKSFRRKRSEGKSGEIAMRIRRTKSVIEDELVVSGEHSHSSGAVNTILVFGRRISLLVKSITN
jgi:hypothetical protein